MRTYSRILVPALLMALALGACGEEDAAEREYTTFTSDDGNFSADFPGTPTRDDRTQRAGDISLNLVHFTVDNVDEAVSVSYVDYPEAVAEQDPQLVLDGIAEGAAQAADGGRAGSEGELTSRSFTTFDEHPAIDFEVDVDSRRLMARAILVGVRMYLLQVVAVEDGDNTSYDRLISSFTLD